MLPPRGPRPRSRSARRSRARRWRGWIEMEARPPRDPGRPRDAAPPRDRESRPRIADLRIRLARAGDAGGIWSVLEPVIRPGETYALPRDMERDAALAWWCAPGHEVHVAEDPQDVLL